MAIYNVHGGHNSKVTGASNLLDEVTEDRKVKNYVIQYLKAQGHTVYDCTDDTGTTKSANLSNIVTKCNKHKAALDISIHLNAGGGTGVEVWLYNSSSSAKSAATRVASKVSSALGIKNRGLKYSTSLYVLRKTNSPAMLVECCFVDNKTDYNAWNAQKCAKAIVEGILNKTISTTSTSSTSTSSTSTSTSSSSSTTTKTVNYKVNVANVSKGDVLNIRKTASASAAITGTLAYNDKNDYTIIQEVVNGKVTWGKLKSGLGYINLAYTKKV